MPREFSPQIEWRGLDTITPYIANAKEHPQEQIDKIAGSIAEFGFDQPIVVDADGVIIKGHGRYQASRKLGLKAVPVVVRTDLSRAAIKASRIADNKVAESGWNDEALRIELIDLEDAGFDLLLTGFSGDELAAMLAKSNPMDDMPELASGDREPFQQMTFTLHDDQAEQVERAIEAAKAMGPFVDSPNENSNGNALARICEAFLTRHGNG